MFLILIFFYYLFKIEICNGLTLWIVCFFFFRSIFLALQILMGFLFFFSTRGGFDSFLWHLQSTNLESHKVKPFFFYYYLKYICIKVKIKTNFRKSARTFISGMINKLLLDLCGKFETIARELSGLNVLWRRIQQIPNRILILE